MSQSPAHTHPAVARSLATWHDMIDRKDMSGLAAIVHPDAVFRSPVAHTPYHSAAAVMMALNAAVVVLEDFTYYRQLASDDGLSVVLEFSARVGDKVLKGIDLVRFDAEGRIVEFEVMVRPLAGLQALATAMAPRVGATLPAYKIKP